MGKKTYRLHTMHTNATPIATSTRPPTPAPAAMGTTDVCGSLADKNASLVELPVVGFDVAVVSCAVVLDVCVVVEVEVEVLVVVTENIQLIRTEVIIIMISIIIMVIMV